MNSMTKLFLITAVIGLSGCATIQSTITKVTGLSCGKQVELLSESALTASEGIVVAQINEKITITKRNELLDDVLEAYDTIEEASANCEIDEDQANVLLAEAKQKINQAKVD